MTEDDKATNDHFDGLVLIEAVAENMSESFDMGAFGQMQPAFPDDPRYMQVGYDEGLLSADGETLIQREMGCVQGTGPLRFAVYLHLYHPERPLQWQFGHVQCPPVQAKSEGRGCTCHGANPGKSSGGRWASKAGF